MRSVGYYWEHLSKGDRYTLCNIINIQCLPADYVDMPRLAFVGTKTAVAAIDHYYSTCMPLNGQLGLQLMYMRGLFITDCEDGKRVHKILSIEGK